MLLQTCHTEGFISQTHKFLTTEITGERQKTTVWRWGRPGRLEEAVTCYSSSGMVLTALSWPRVYFSWWHFSVMSLVCLLPIWVMGRSRWEATVYGVWALMTDRLTCCTRSTARARSEDTSPWILSIWPIFRAAPRTLQSVRTILSALASERKALESRTDLLSPLKTKKPY